MKLAVVIGILGCLSAVSGKLDTCKYLVKYSNHFEYILTRNRWRFRPASPYSTSSPDTAEYGGLPRTINTFSKTSGFVQINVNTFTKTEVFLSVFVQKLCSVNGAKFKVSALMYP